MAYQSTNFMFRSLTDEEEAQFRQYTRDTYKPGDPISGVWHPVCQDEAKRMNEGFDHLTHAITSILGKPT